VRLFSSLLSSSRIVALTAHLVPLGLVLCMARDASAQSDADRATARELGQQGFAALDAKDYVTAEDRLRRADKLVHAPTLMLGLARALNGEHKYVEAQEMYQRIIREGVPANAPDAFKQALEDARREVGAVSPLIGGVTIVVGAGGVTDLPNKKVTIDGTPVNNASLGVRRLIDPGPHVLTATADGYKSVEVKFTVPEGGNVDQPVNLEKDPNWVPPSTGGAEQNPGGPGTPPGPGGPGTPPPPPGGEQPATGGMPSYVPFIGFGVGAAGLLLGGITGAIAIGDRSKLAGECTGTTCDPSHQGDLNSYHSMGTLSTVGFVVGGVGVAAGAVLLLMQPHGSAAVRPATGLHVTPVLGPGSLGAVGTF
jgi:hypothetical protein